MTQFIKFPSISQLRDVIKTVKSNREYQLQINPASGLAEMPTLEFRGTIKMHGTNAAIVARRDGDFWVQSRNRVITPLSDNAGFACFAFSVKQQFDDIIAKVRNARTIADNQFVAVFGEWIGPGIQSGIGLNQLKTKHFVVFNIAVVTNGGDDYDYDWLKQNELTQIVRSSDRPTTIKDVYEFPTKTIHLNLSKVDQTIVDQLMAHTIEVEQECPVAKMLGASAETGAMTGEGLVWHCVTPGYEGRQYWFKVKGEKHSKSHVAALAVAPDSALGEKIKIVAAEVTPVWRLEQMMEETFDTLNGGEVVITRMGDFIRAVMADIVKEDLDVITSNKLELKQVGGDIARIARTFLMEKCYLSA